MKILRWGHAGIISGVRRKLKILDSATCQDSWSHLSGGGPKTSLYLCIYIYIYTRCNRGAIAPGSTPYQKIESRFGLLFELFMRIYKCFSTPPDAPKMTPMTPKPPPNDPKMTSRWSQNEPRGPKMTPWSQNDPPIIPNWYPDDPRMIPWSQNDPPMIPNWYPDDPRMIPRWP